QHSRQTSTKSGAPATRHPCRLSPYLPSLIMGSHSMSVADIRKSYEKSELLEETLQATPMDQFNLWFQQVLKANVPEVNAMTLATTTPDGRPSARIVLLKGYDDNGFVFFTNYQ